MILSRPASGTWQENGPTADFTQSESQGFVPQSTQRPHVGHGVVAAGQSGTWQENGPTARFHTVGEPGFRPPEHTAAPRRAWCCRGRSEHDLTRETLTC